MSAATLDCPADGCAVQFFGTVARNLHVRREHPGLSPERPLEDPAFEEREDPKVVPKASEPTQVSCPECGKTFDDGRRLGPHRNKAHGYRKGQAQGSDSPPSPEEPKSEPAAEATGDRPARQRRRPATARRGKGKTSKAEAGSRNSRNSRNLRKPPASRDQVVVKMALDAGDKMAIAARRFVGIISAYQATGSGDVDEIETAMWRLGAAVADYEDSRP